MYIHMYIIFLYMSPFPDGSLRVDANVSVAPVDSNRLGTRSEVKNISGIRFLARAVGETVNP